MLGGRKTCFIGTCFLYSFNSKHWILEGSAKYMECDVQTYLMYFWVGEVTRFAIRFRIDLVLTPSNERCDDEGPLAPRAGQILALSLSHPRAWRRRSLSILLRFNFACFIWQKCPSAWRKKRFFSQRQNKSLWHLPLHVFLYTFCLDNNGSGRHTDLFIPISREKVLVCGCEKFLPALA